MRLFFGVRRNRDRHLLNLPGGIVLIDRARIYVKAGNGGSGSMSFRREKFVPMGGPDGGDGGRGGDVLLVVKSNVTSLLAFQFNQHFEAQNGQPGSSRQKTGKSGNHLPIPVPPGTVVFDDETGEQLADLTDPSDSYRVVKGGKGGLGNIHFKTSVRQAPRIAELGEPGEELWIRLELRLIADVGLVGLPNAGKSTFLAAASRARPKIADYPFTTLEPNLGVVEIGGPGGQTYVLADVPGLIEGAAEGAGLGHEFLRHVTRTKVLIHVVDASGGLEERDPLADFDLIEAELKAYNDELAAKPTLVALNKLDIPEAQANAKRLRAAIEKRGYRVFEISTATGEGMKPLLEATAQVLRDAEIAAVEEAKRQARERKVYTLEEVDEKSWKVRRMSAHHFEVTGIAIERFTKMTNFDLDDAVNRFQRVLEVSGISSELERQGIEDGDTVHLAGRELVWGDQEPDMEPKKRRTAAQRLAARKRGGGQLVDEDDELAVEDDED
jgi:GTP-binding protein